MKRADEYLIVLRSCLSSNCVVKLLVGNTLKYETAGRRDKTESEDFGEACEQARKPTGLADGFRFAERSEQRLS